ncbi:MAG: hypothetical protein HN348_03290 [Proteobacteria bacterium]|nr:hypothetical protein [Pseudomonadota bacterium]
MSRDRSPLPTPAPSPVQRQAETGSQPPPTDVFAQGAQEVEEKAPFASVPDEAIEAVDTKSRPEPLLPKTTSIGAIHQPTLRPTRPGRPPAQRDLSAFGATVRKTRISIPGTTRTSPTDSASPVQFKATAPLPTMRDLPPTKEEPEPELEAEPVQMPFVQEMRVEEPRHESKTSSSSKNEAQKRREAIKAVQRKLASEAKKKQQASKGAAATDKDAGFEEFVESIKENESFEWTAPQGVVQQQTVMEQPRVIHKHRESTQPPVERELLRALKTLTTKNPEARAMLREIRREVADLLRRREIRRIK